ncbi:heat shock factor protein 2 isoform X2 [Polyodon spathula]|uniref:heat shock factor protein 2 isoform X2 n=1 Tax=Polyodon spathula TaxID=7913 RepID=UPI001B7E1E08|nr:heat shock factor protein 2 isoform X2 [Polyodon spathula]
MEFSRGCRYQRIHQLEPDGFRKVIHMDTGIVKQERDGPIEFQHPFFKQEQDDLLENIKRKVSSARPEDNIICQEDLTKIQSSVQNAQAKQEGLELMLTTLQRENEALWREVSDLRQKHANQQQVIKKIIQFIISLVQNNRVVSLKRKRPLLMNNNGSKSKFIHQVYEEGSTSSLSGLKKKQGTSDDVAICDITDDAAEDLKKPEGTTQRNQEIKNTTNMVETIQEEDGSCDDVVIVNGEKSEKSTSLPTAETLETSSAISESTPLASSALQTNKQPALSSEDPVKMMDLILNENGALSQNISLLGKVELMDYLDSIDCSLEDFQAMLHGKQFSIDPDLLLDLFNPNCQVNTSDFNICTTNGTEPPKDDLMSKENNNSETYADKQLIQYKSCPHMAFLDGCSTLISETNTLIPELSESQLLHPKESSDILDTTFELEETSRSKLIRLEPLTEAEATEATLFNLCELSPVETPILEM